MLSLLSNISDADKVSELPLPFWALVTVAVGGVAIIYILIIIIALKRRQEREEEDYYYAYENDIVEGSAVKTVGKKLTKPKPKRKGRFGFTFNLNIFLGANTVDNSNKIEVIGIKKEK